MRKGGIKNSEQPTAERAEVTKDGPIADEILRKLKLEAKQEKAVRLDEIEKEKKRLNEIFSRKDKASSN